MIAARSRMPLIEWLVAFFMLAMLVIAALLIMTPFLLFDYLFLWLFTFGEGWSGLEWDTRLSFSVAFLVSLLAGGFMACMALSKLANQTKDAFKELLER